MNNLLPKALLNVIDELGKLPGCRRSHSRALCLLFATRQTRVNVAKLADSINALHSGVKSCPVAFALIDASEDVSPLYSAIRP